MSKSERILEITWFMPSILYLYIVPLNFFLLIQMPLGSLVWQSKMVEISVFLALQEGSPYSSWLPSLEQVVSRVPGLLSCALSFRTISLLHFSNVPSSLTSPPALLPSIPHPPLKHPVPLSSFCGNLISDSILLPSFIPEGTCLLGSHLSKN